MKFLCPHCQAPIYSRKNKVCGVCERPLPKELLMSDAETAFWKKEMDKEEKQARQFKQQMNDVGSHDGPGDIGGIASF